MCNIITTLLRFLLQILYPNASPLGKDFLTTGVLPSGASWDMAAMICVALDSRSHQAP
ncbi:hypothetical protein KC19_11G085500 [Ceratodon purpureus]|uniref:Uncharacterized protein n=1 Tax=Ceratodon purpureus TaxID=3225 RepID=A0A8T0GCY5_CERPU|nr:hypothetical protein KC19_11G085500 [Ceratodon purpureus]